MPPKKLWPAAAAAGSSSAAASAPAASAAEEGWLPAWLEYKHASERDVVVGENGTVLGATLQLTYVAWWRLSLDKDDQGRTVIVGVCKARKADGTPCAYSTKMSYGGASDFEFGNAMRHFKFAHTSVLNVAHHHLLKEKSKDAEPVVETFTKESIKKEKDALVKLVATSGYPLSYFTSSSLAWAEYCSFSKKPTIPRSTLKDAYAAQVVDLVKKQRDKAMEQINAPFDVYGMKLPGRVAIIFDGYKARNGENKTAIHLQAGVLLPPSMLTKTPAALRPVNFPFALKAGEQEEVEAVDADGNAYSVAVPVKHTASNMAAQLASEFDKLALIGGRGRVLEIHSDAASAAMGVSAEPEWSSGGIWLLDADGGGAAGPRAAACNVHASDLAAEDIPKNVPEFHELLVWTEKIESFLQREALASLLYQAQRAKGAPERKMISHGATRFFTRIIGLKQVVDEAPHICAIPLEAIKDLGDRAKLRGYQIKLANDLEQLRLIVEIFDFTMRHSQRLSSWNQYTQSLELLYYVRHDNHLDAVEAKELALRTTSDGDVGAPGLFVDVLKSFRKSNFLRRAALAYWDVEGMVPEGVGELDKELTALQQSRRLARDRVAQGASLLDPAISERDFVMTGASVDHAYAHLVSTLKAGIMLMLEVKDAAGDGDDDEPAAAAAAAAAPPPKKPKVDSKFKSFEDEMAAIKDQSKGKFESEGQFKERVAAEEKACKLRWSRGGSRAQQPSLHDPNAEKWAEKTSSEFLARERPGFLEYRHTNFGPKFGDAFAPFSFVNEAGEVIDELENEQRYELWGKLKSDFPAHFYCAAALLGMPSTSISVESTFSIAAYVMSKLRSRLSDANHETLTLAKITLERDLAEKAKENKLIAELAKVELFRRKHGYVDPCELDAILGEGT